LSEEEVFFTEKAGISGKLRKAESGEEATGNYRMETLASINSEVPANPLSCRQWKAWNIWANISRCR
jgi:hypothetical protein